MVHFVHICMLFSKKNKPCENIQVTVIVTMIFKWIMDHGYDSNEMTSFIFSIHIWILSVEWKFIQWLGYYNFPGFVYWWIYNICHNPKISGAPQRVEILVVKLVHLYWVNLQQAGTTLASWYLIIITKLMINGVWTEIKNSKHRYCPYNDKYTYYY